jgi:capsular polysaccharide biosynthesis protein
MEFKQYMALLGRWYWIILLGLVLGAASGILISRGQTPVYQATAKVLVMRVPDTSGSGLAYLGDQQLAVTYSELINTQPVVDAASSQLGFEIDVNQITISQNTDSQIISISAQDSDPQRCVLIANTTVEMATKRYVDLQVSQYTALEHDVQSQLTLLENRMTSLQSQITATSNTIITDQTDEILSKMTPLQDEVNQLQQDIAALTPASSTILTNADQRILLAQKQTRLDQILPLLTSYQTAYSNLAVFNTPIITGSVDENNLTLFKSQMTVYQQSYVDLIGKLELLQQSYVKGISNVTRIQDAYTPTRPIRPQILINTLLTTVVGLLLAIVVIFVLENLQITPRATKKKMKATL